MVAEEKFTTNEVTVFVWIEARVFVSYKCFLTWHMYEPFLYFIYFRALDSCVYMSPVFIWIHTVCLFKVAKLDVHKKTLCKSTHIYTNIWGMWNSYIIFNFNSLVQMAASYISGKYYSKTIKLKHLSHSYGVIYEGCKFRGFLCEFSSWDYCFIGLRYLGRVQVNHEI